LHFDDPKFHFFLLFFCCWKNKEIENDKRNAETLSREALERPKKIEAPPPPSTDAEAPPTVRKERPARRTQAPVGAPVNAAAAAAEGAPVAEKTAFRPQRLSEVPFKTKIKNNLISPFISSSVD